MTENTNLVLQADKPVGHENTAKHLFLDLSRSLEVSLPTGIPKELLINAALNSIRKNPRLLECTQASMASALMYCAQTGLMPDTPTQECHLIPFRNRGKLEVQWIGGFRGLQRLARQSEEVAYLEAHVVHAKDVFEYERGLKPILMHKPFDEGTDPGVVTHFYSIIRWSNPDFMPLFEVMTKAQVDKVRAGSKAKDLDAWTNHYEEMGRKTVLRRVVKYAPMTREFAVAVDLDNKAAAGEDQDIHDTIAEVVGSQEVKPKESKTNKLADKIGADQEQHRTIEECMTLLDENKEVLAPDYVEQFPKDRIEQFSPEARDVWYVTTEEKIEEAIANRGSGLSKAKEEEKGETGSEEVEP